MDGAAVLRRATDGGPAERRHPSSDRGHVRRRGAACPPGGRLRRGAASRRAFFHARDYGWLLANPFGRSSYGKGDSAAVTLSPGGTLDLHYAVVLHAAVPDDALAELARAVTAP